MRYVDVCSLYPYVLKCKPFPIGHPQNITSDFEDVNQYFGLIRCRAHPEACIIPNYLTRPVENYCFLYAVPVQNNVTWDPTIDASTPMPNAA
jgi:hypothetical protein